ARAAASKICNHVNAISVNEEVRPIVVRRRSGDHVLGNGWAADSLRGWSSVARRKLQNVGLVSGRESICVAHQFVKFRGTDVVAALRIIAPTIRANVSSGPNSIARERLVRGWSFKISVTVENTLRDDVRAGRDSEAVKRSDLIRLARCAIARDDPGHMRAVTMFVGGVRQIAIIEERIGAASQVWVHGGGFSGVQTAV